MASLSIGALCGAIAALVLPTGQGCVQCVKFFSDGSCMEPSGPVMADDLEGTWCQEPDNRGRALCLFVSDSHYTWASFDCNETGDLSGGLEFTPRHGSCFGFSSLYSASVDWTNTGINVFVDTPEGISRKLALNYAE